MKTYQATDGHILLSYYEYLFDEYLHSNNIPHDIDDYFCSESKCRYDFLIDDVYVEIWGITKAASKLYNNYCERRLRKEKLYEKHELKLISIEGKDFRRNSKELQTFFKEKLAEFNICSQDERIDYPIFNRRKIDYWCDKTILSELELIVERENKFPTANELNLAKKHSLGTAIIKHGGYRKFAKILGFEPKTKEYSETRLLNELKTLTKKLKHFPCDRELQEMKRSDLAGSIKTHGGYGYFKEKITGNRTKRPYGYWKKEENIIEELKVLCDELGRFPKYNELGHIAKGIDKSGKGMKYFEDIS